jgi:hypothetical protein
MKSGLVLAVHFSRQRTILVNLPCHLVAGFSYRETGHRGSSAGSNVLLCCTDLADSSDKGAFPYILLQAGYRSKKQHLSHIWLHTKFHWLTFFSGICDLLHV